MRARQGHPEACRKPIWTGDGGVFSATVTTAGARAHARMSETTCAMMTEVVSPFSAPRGAGLQIPDVVPKWLPTQVSPPAGHASRASSSPLAWAALELNLLWFAPSVAANP